MIGMVSVSIAPLNLINLGSELGTFVEVMAASATFESSMFVFAPVEMSCTGTTFRTIALPTAASMAFCRGSDGGAGIILSVVCVRPILVSGVELVKDSSGCIDSRFSEVILTEKSSDGGSGFTLSEVCVRPLPGSEVELIEDSSGRVDSRLSEMTSTGEGSDGGSGFTLSEVCVRPLPGSEVELLKIPQNVSILAFLR